MTLHLEAVTYDVASAADLDTAVTFWAGLLGRDPVAGQASGPALSALLPGPDHEVGLRFEVPDDADGPALRSTRDLHLHLTTRDDDDRRAVLERAASLGARPLDVGQLPEEEHVVLGDPGGRAFCVIEPGNGYLVGTGFLGEVACDGTRAVGEFWSTALGWPLVWDQDGETVVQAPAGGTKVAWGGEPVEPKHGRNPQRLDLVTDEPEREVARLVDLGARALPTRAGWLELADPDGNELRLRPA
ncbi:VOC family protein [Nocardioides litoris]|uniref:VOC family protein n=1 Tax=Nocardioides litoris TaxID=1926648 RepID=UPI001122C0AA|nr:VOC family protein [Nocardioides litoris]